MKRACTLFALALLFGGCGDPAVATLDARSTDARSLDAPGLDSFVCCSCPT